MTLKSKVEVLSKYKGSSKFQFWKNLKPKDILEAEVVIKRIERRRNTIYATTITFRKYNFEENKTEVFSCSMTEAANYLNQLEYKEL